ncbi:MAG: ABC-type transport auxiliary lipoprotein family protein [Phenylobacterium sp.]
MTRATLRFGPMLKIIGVAAIALALSGCISLLPKSKPSQLYRFGQPAAEASPKTGTVGVFQANGLFPSEASGDRILTFAGGKAAYVAQSRWVAPASVLWTEAVQSAFDADAGRVRLNVRGQAAKSEYVLRLDVRSFEARYEGGTGSAPTIVVRVRGVMSKMDMSKVTEQVFEVKTRASDNRVGAIVSAYDKAVADVLGQIVTWTNATIA